MPTDIKLNPTTHDIDLSSGGLALHTEQVTVIAQRVKIALLLKLGEWFKDVNAGVPYYQEFFSKKGNKEFADQFLIDYLANVPEISSVASYKSTVQAGRVLKVECILETTSGEIININTGVTNA